MNERLQKLSRDLGDGLTDDILDECQFLLLIVDLSVLRHCCQQLNVNFVS